MLQKKLTDVEKELHQLQTDHDQLLSRLKDKEAELLTSYTSLNQLTAEKDELQKKLNDAEERINRLTEEKTVSNKQITEQIPTSEISYENNNDVSAQRHFIRSDGTSDEQIVSNQTHSMDTPEETPDINAAVKTNFREPLSGIEMMYVPAGNFLFGPKTGSDTGASQAEIYLDGFWIGETEVTNSQYRKCVEADVCLETDLMDLKSKSLSNFPLTYVTYKQAQRFCSWIGGSLPTEYQWEKAARGTDGRIYPWGDLVPEKGNDLANIPDDESDLMAVGSFPNGASPYDAKDMAGNAWEWTSTRFSPDFYQSLLESAAEKAIINPQGPEEGEYYVIRGGSASPSEAATYKDSLQTIFRSRSESPKYYLGFRCVIQDPAE